MRKIPTLYQRDHSVWPPELTDKVNPDCQWVFTDPGVKATRKFDGICFRLDDDGFWWARREVPHLKVIPKGFVFVQVDERTGKLMGWEPLEQSPFLKYHAEGVANTWAGVGYTFTPGTYELVGPKINGNPGREELHRLRPHGAQEMKLTEPLLHATLKTRLLELHAEYHVEGVVWHHPDGQRMAKLKARDFDPHVNAVAA